MATTPGAMSLYDIQSRVLHLLREPGPDTNGTGVVPTSGDFPAATLTRDANIWLGSMIGETGLAPSLTDTVVTVPITAGLDFALPTYAAALYRVEYTPAGQQTYKLDAYSMEEFDSVTGNVVPTDQGQPLYYRAPFNNTIRLQPAPTYANAGLASGSFVVGNTFLAGDRITLHLINGGTSVAVGPYTVLSTDTNASIALALVGLINASLAVTGGSAFLSAASASSGTIQLVALSAGTASNAFTYYASVTSTNGTVAPSASTNFAGGGTADTITLYLATLGSILVNPTDVPAIPPQFHRGIMYGMLSEYWLRKNDEPQATSYERKYERVVARMKSHIFDEQQSSQPTGAGDDTDDGVTGWAAG